MKSKLFSIFFVGITILNFFSGPSFADQNVLLIIADDLGVDVLDIDHGANIIQITTEVVSTGTQQAFVLPNLSTLLANGVYFTNTWSTPVCSPTRATIYTGLQPWRTGVGYPVGNYVLEDVLPDGTPVNTIANAICDSTTARTCGLFGKWHLGGNDDPMVNFSKTPLGRGWDYYAGHLGGALHDGETYSSWTKYTSNEAKDGYTEEGNNGLIGASNRVTTYATQDVVSEAKAWIAEQTGIWFATLAFNAPHDLFHVPPDATSYDSSTDTNGNKGQYNTMAQSLDYYIGKLWDSSYGSDINDKLSNTLIIFLGDNGTPGGVANVSPAKNSVYLGGIHVPLIIADGARVVDPAAAPTFLDASVIGETQDNQVNVADLYRTTIRRTGALVSSGFGTHSYNLRGYLKGITPSKQRLYNFTQKYKNNGDAHATISNGTFKLNYQNGTWELFDIVADPTESNNVYGDPAFTTEQTELMDEIIKRRKTSDPSIPW